VSLAAEPLPQSEPLSHTIPHNLEAEQAFLSSLLHHNGYYEEIGEFLIADHFSHRAHQKIYHAMGRLIERGQVADPVTLKDFFEKDDDLKAAGGTEYLAYLATHSLGFGDTREYAQLIYDLSLRRSLIDVGQELVQKAQGITLDAPAESHIEWAEQRLYDLATTGQAESGFVDFGNALASAIVTAEKAFKRDNKIVGVTTGLRDMDKWLGGLHPSDLIILAGRPSMGKTGLATTIAFNAARAALRGQSQGGLTAFFSLEMSSEQLASRLLAQASRVASDRIRRGEVTQEEFLTFTEISRELASLPLYIDDTPALTVSALRTRTRRLKRKYGLGLIIVDYLQLLQGSSTNRQDNRVNEVSQITRSLKALAKEMHVPVIALSQLSRAVEARDDKRPQLSDLRESGSIEQDADVVMFVYREEYYVARQQVPEGHEKFSEWQKKMNECYNIAEVILAKQRHGPIGTVRLYYEAPLVKFGNLDHETNSALSES
jgi:replicative DNA helicase